MRKFGYVTLAAALLAGVQVPAVAGSDEEEAEAPPRAMLLFPILEPERGRKLFGAKGCVVCHSVNGVGGEEGPALDYDMDKGPINPFDIAADMWSHASVMIPLQKADLGHQIELDASDFADLTAFLTSPAEQKKFELSDVPADIREILEKELGEEGEEEHE